MSLATRYRFQGIVSWMLLCAVASTPSIAQRYDAWSLADSVTIGEHFQFAVTVEHDGAGSALFPHDFLPDSLSSESVYEIGDFTVLGHTMPERRTVGPNWVVDSLLYEVATFALDTALVAGLPVGIVSDTDTLLAATPPIRVRVISLVPDDATGIRDIAPIADFPATSWFWYLLPVALFLAVAYWFWRRRKGRDDLILDIPSEPPVPPYEEALERLKRLEQLDLQDESNIKPFYVELSEVLRTYLMRTTEVPALESTTAELIAMLRRTSVEHELPDEMVTVIRSILAHADLVKYADMRPAADTGHRSLGDTRATIEESERQFKERLEEEEHDIIESGDRAEDVEAADIET